MSLDTKSRWGRVRAGRVRILWLFLGAFLLVSTLPIGLYHRQVLQLSQDKLVDTERVTGKFPGRAGSVRGESAAAGLRHLPAIEATASGQVSQRSSGIGSPKPAGLRRGRALERRERQLYGNAGRGRFPGTHPSSFAGSQRAGTHGFSSGSQRPPRGPPGDEKFRSRGGCQQQFTCGKSEGTAARAPQHGNGAFYRNGQETPGRDDWNVQHFS